MHCVQHSHRDLHDCEHGKAVVLHVNSLRSIVDSRFGSKQKAQGSTSSTEGMVRTAAIEACFD